MFSLVASVIQRTSLAGVFLLMLAENLAPLIPSELIMPMAGFAAARGAMDPVAAVVAGAVGSILGGIAWYWVGRRLGLERLLRWTERAGRWAAITPDELRRGQAAFSRWSGAAVLVGRALPGVRGVICIPAGVARMPFGPFLLWSSLGATLWSALLVAAGYLLRAQYARVGHWLNPVADVFLGTCLALYVFRLARYRPARSQP